MHLPCVLSQYLMSVLLSTTTVEALGLFLVMAVVYRALKRARLLLPPGPKGFPLIGNLLDVPITNIAETYTKWAQKYGKWLLNLFCRHPGTAHQHSF